MKTFRLLAPTAFFAILTNAAILSAQTISSQWLGNGSPNQSNGNWSAASLWSPNGVPNNSGPTIYDVTIASDPDGAVFNGPQLDTNITIHNLSLLNLAFIDNQGHVGTNLSVTGSTTISNTAGHDFDYAAVWSAGGAYLLGTLSNYNSTTHVFNGPFFRVTNGGTIGFRGADIVTINGVIHIVGPTSQLIDQDTNANALRNLAVNNGGFTFADGYNFTTVGDFTNNFGMTISTGNGMTTVFTVTGSLTNYNSGTHTLANGSYDVEVTDVPGTATFRFPGADIRNLSNAYIKLIGAGASIQDLTGQNALRNLQGISHGALTNSGTLIITPNGGTFTNDGASHTIDNGATITIDGDHNSMNGGTTNIAGPTDDSNTTLIIDGHSIIDGGGIDMGGTPGVNTQYHTELQIMNGIEFRGAYLTGTGTTFADVALIQGSTLNPGHSPGQLTFEGNLSLDNTTTTYIQIGGISPGDEFDQIIQSGAFTINLGGGALEVSLIGFETPISNFDSFDIITSDNLILGSFGNVASGDRLATSDGIGSFVVTYASQNKVTLSSFAPVLVVTSAVSRKTHGAVDYDIPLNLTGAPTVECRDNGGNHQIILTFANDVVAGDADLATQNGGSISGTSFSDNTMTVDLSGVADQQTITVTLNNVTDVYDQVLPPTEVRVSLLVGDTNGNGTVNGTDVSQTKLQSGQPVTEANFREDVVVSGTITATDVSQVKLKSGNGLPPLSTNRQSNKPHGR